MTRIFKVAFCVLTLAASVTLAGCGKAEKKATTDDKADTTATDTTE